MHILDSPSTLKPELDLQARSALFKVVQIHVEYARQLSPMHAVLEDECTLRMTEAWTCTGTLLTLYRNLMRKSVHMADNEAYWAQTKHVRDYAMELISLGNTWVWPRWASGFEYIDIALRTARMLASELQPEEARSLIPWLVRQAIYHDDTEQDRLHGIVEILHWSDLLGSPKVDWLPDNEMPLVYWLLTRLYGVEVVSLHRILHGDNWCSWKGLLVDRSNPLDMKPLSELLFGVDHLVLNPISAHSEVTLPESFNDTDT